VLNDITVLIADDHQAIREYIRGVIDEQSDMVVIGEAEDGERAVELVRRLSPDVVIMDVSMPNLGGIEATRQIRAEGSSSKVIGFSVHFHEWLKSTMLQAGASAYLVKDSVEELLPTIRAVVSRESFTERASSQSEAAS
jgi:two-component system, NarL family, response regulator NreC